MKNELDISLIINPELMAAQELFNHLKLPSAAKIESFSVRTFEVVEFKTDLKGLEKVKEKQYKEYQKGEQKKAEQTIEEFVVQQSVSI